MRVASLESVLAVATLVSATVVVLWGLKILYGMWTGRTLASRLQPPSRLRLSSGNFRGGGGLLSNRATFFIAIAFRATARSNFSIRKSFSTSQARGATFRHHTVTNPMLMALQSLAVLQSTLPKRLSSNSTNKTECWKWLTTTPASL
jgi:hypothetical protein